jgi:hypothetical protein
LGIETTLLIASLAVAAASAGIGFVQQNQAAKAASQQADWAQEAANEQAQAQYKEIQRQQEEVNKTAEEQRSDRMRQARAELGTLTVMAGESGASGQTLGALAQDLGYTSGLDLSRIEQNRKANIEAGEASKVAARQGAQNAINIAANQKAVAQTQKRFSGYGAGIQFAGDAANSVWKYDQMKDKPRGGGKT